MVQVLYFAFSLLPLCYPVLPCVTLCYPVLPCVTLCYVVNHQLIPSNSTSSQIQEKLDQELESFIRAAKSSTSNNEDSMIFEAVHCKPVGTIVSARQENTLEFHPCVIIEHRDSEVSN